MNILAQAQATFAQAIVSSVNDAFNIIVPDENQSMMVKAMSRPRSRSQGEFMFPCSSLCKLISGRKPSDIAIALSTQINQLITIDPIYSSSFESVTPSGVYLHLRLRAEYFASVIHAINEGSFLQPLRHDRQEKVMIEYSQPNTHKAFHVGHMRNVALGGSVIRLFEQMGHVVVAVNYLGDEGAHVAKCLWLLRQRLHDQDITLDQLDIPSDRKGEYLGLLYAEANDLLDLSSLTKYPYLGVIAAKVLSKEPHPSAEAPSNWNLCSLNIGADQTVTVVCGGVGYEVGDMVAYIPVGAKLKKQLIATKNMKGVMSSGLILAYNEVGATPPSAHVDSVLASLKDVTLSKGKKGNSAAAIQASMIMLIEEECEPGQSLIEMGKIDKSQPSSVLETFKNKKAEVDSILLKMESGDKEMSELWRITKQWSMDEFHSIYNWLEARFDHEFFESEVSSESRELVLANAKLSPDQGGIMTESHGAIGCDLSMRSPPLPFLLLIKSNGAGLYATKDLSLAMRKFTQFGIERSVYIVDSAQSLHFQQVFACLDRLGYRQAKACFHLSYGQVVGPTGKMSSRQGTVIYFSQLKAQLEAEIMSTYLDKYKGVWTDSEIRNVLHQICLATIKYRMLNQDPGKDIVFELKDWTAKTGDTGPYLCYAYARIRAIQAKVEAPADTILDMSLLNSDHDRALLFAINSFWSTVEKAAYEYKPNIITKYLYDMSKDFNSWYEVSPINGSEDGLKLARLELVAAVASIIKTGLYLLGLNAVERM